MHGGVTLAELTKPDAGAVQRGIDNLAAHIDAASQYSKPVLVAINQRGEDTAEDAVIDEFCKSAA